MFMGFESRGRDGPEVAEDTRRATGPLLTTALMAMIKVEQMIWAAGRDIKQKASEWSNVQIETIGKGGELKTQSCYFNSQHLFSNIMFYLCQLTGLCLFVL